LNKSLGIDNQLNLQPLSPLQRKSQPSDHMVGSMGASPHPDNSRVGSRLGRGEKRGRKEAFKVTTELEAQAEGIHSVVLLV
jgi:hypothetical protein